MRRHSCEYLADSLTAARGRGDRGWPNSLLSGNAVNTPTSLQHTFSF